MTLNVRPMTESDLDDVYAIERNAHITPWGRDIIRDCVLVGYDCQVLEIDNGETVLLAGYIISRHSEKECHILNLCIDSTMQAKGYGRQFLEIYLSALEKSNQADSVILEVRPSNKKALHLYNSIGFQQVEYKKDYYNDANGTEDAVLLKKIIHP